MPEIFSKLIVKIPDQRDWGCSVVDNVNYVQMPATHCPGASIVDFEQINGGWARSTLKTKNTNSNSNY